MDYKQLLIRYMASVIDCEGADYIDGPSGYSIVLTQDEKLDLISVLPLVREELERSEEFERRRRAEVQGEK